MPVAIACLEQEDLGCGCRCKIRAHLDLLSILRLWGKICQNVYQVGGIKGCKYKTSSWHLNRFPDADNIESTLLFLTFGALVANPKELLYTVANPARGLLNREKKEKRKSLAAPPPPARCSFGEKKRKKKKSRDTYLGATQVGVTQVVSVRLASVQGFLRLVN